MSVYTHLYSFAPQNGFGTSGAGPAFVKEERDWHSLSKANETQAFSTLFSGMVKREFPILRWRELPSSSEVIHIWTRIFIAIAH
jgi:hypothetical protein